ncbi:MAG: 30S ribosomal protein S17e [Nanoarchaeota archaeon]
MGRVRSTYVKTSADKIYEVGKEDFTDNFDKNKDLVKKYATIPSKKMRNTIVGRVTTLKKRELRGEE